jgi:hypothetical protein
MVTFQGLNSVLDRTLFTNRGPIVKRPLDLLIGSNLQIVSEDEVEIPTGNFTSSDVGRTLEITGSPAGRNDTDSAIIEVPSTTRLRLSNVSFDISDIALTTADIVALANNLKAKFNAHRTQNIDVDGVDEGVHGTHDSVNIVIAADATNLATAITLLNNIKAKFGAHVILISGTPPTHNEADTENVPVAPDASQLASAVQLVNDIRRKFEAHREDRFIHQHQDTVNVITVDPVSVTTGVYPGPLTGPFSWTLRDSRLGMVADDPTDVEVTVNGSPAQVDIVYGLLGAVVLTAKPGGLDTVLIDYNFLNNPPARFLRLNSPEFNTNQVGNRGYAGLPKHRYRSRSYIIDPSSSPDFISAVQPRRVGWKYKGVERAYSATLNDPTTLLTNVPTNRIAYRVLFDQVREETIRYDPTTLPQDATDPWTLEGQGTFSLAAGGNELTVIDSNVQTGPDSAPPFFTHSIDLRAESFISSAFRVRVLDDPTTLISDGVFTGVVFGLSDGQRTAMVGFITTDATNLSSSLVMANDLRAKFDLHLTNLGSHNPDDESELVGVVNASDLTSLIILLNEIKARFNAHIAKGSGVGNVHQTADVVNTVTLADATDLDSSIELTNDLRSKFNAHREQSLVHFSNDLINDVGQVKQAGILTNRGFSEFQGSWDSVASDWTDFRTYRLFLDSDGTASLFLGGEVDASVIVQPLDLPPISSIDGKFDPVQQTFFGSIARDATSESRWQFIRVNIQPIDGNLIEDNKSVDYDASVIPELDSIAPWITVGQGGAERVIAGNILQIDSTASEFGVNLDALGQASGAFRGFIRLEPILTRSTAMSVEFRASMDYFTHSLDNRAASFVLDDDNYTVQFCFLQFDPSPATVTGTASEPFTILLNDTLILKVGDDPEFTVLFDGADTTVALVVAKINAAAGFTLADNSGGRVRLTTTGGGISSKIEILSGSAVVKLGFSVGKYFGLDSNPDPKLSWFGQDLPDLDDPTWTRGGLQSTTMLGRTMRATDASTIDYVVFSLDDPIVTNQAFNFSVNWKLNFRLNVRTFIPGDPIPTVAPYSDLFSAGALVSIDEGAGGKTLELHLSVDGTGDGFLNLLSYNSSTLALDVMAQYAFTWNDGQTHTFNIYTSKNADSIIILGDGVVLSPLAGPAPSYSGLNPAVTLGPSISFGSGSEPVLGSDMRSSQSVVDWESVAIFRDSKLDDPTSADRRFIGIFKGGDPSLLASYYLHQIDWTVPHVYRIVRNPVTSVSVFVDGGAVPVISAAYDVLTFPPVSSSFLSIVSSERPTVAFGSFSSRAIGRTRWEYIRYSIGKITLTDRLVPPRQITNQHNAINSPDHLFTTKPHSHQGFTVYSGGTVLDDFMADEEVAAYTELGESTPPVPQTQNLESRGGFVKVGTPLKSIPSLVLVNTEGFIADLEDDTTNVLTLTTSLTQLILLANDLRVQYEAHRIFLTVHGVADGTNVVTAPVATNLATAITLLNDIRIQYEAHRVLLAGVHSISDTFNVVLAPSSTDLESAVTLANDLRVQYEAHRIDTGGAFHLVADLVNEITASVAEDPTANSIAVSNEWREKYLLHVVQYRVHLADDEENIVLPSEATDLASAILLANAEKDQFNLHRVFTIREVQKVHSTDDTTNVVTAPDATDLPTLTTLIEDLIAKYGAHLLESGVHGSSMFIRIDPPSRVLYESMKFWTFEEGEEGHVYPFSDDETLHWDGFKLQRDVIFHYDGSVLPENADELDVQNLANDLKAKYDAHRTGISPISSTNWPGIPDASGNSLPGVATNMEYYDDIAIDSPGGTYSIRSLVFDGVDEYVTMGNVLGSIFEHNVAFSISFWFKATIDFVNDRTLLSKIEGATTYRGWEIRIPAGFPIYFRLTHDEGSGADYVEIRTPGGETDGLWHHVVVTKTTGRSAGSGDFHIYVDGVDQPLTITRDALTANSTATANALMVAARDVSGDERYLDGSIDEVAIYSDVLTPTEVTWIYNGKSPRDLLDGAAPTNLEAWWRMGETKVHPVDDLVNVIASPAATDLATSLTLLTELKTKVNAHMTEPTVHVADDPRNESYSVDPTEVKTAIAIANELRLKFERHRVSTDAHLVADIVNEMLVNEAPPVADSGWQRSDSGSGTAFVSSGAGVLTYGTTVAPMTTAYRKETGLPDVTSLRFEMTVRMKINTWSADPNIDTGIYAGFLSSMGPGVAAAVGFDAIDDIPYVKIHDVNSDVALFRVPFEWNDGSFHSYTLVRDPVTDSLSLVISS